MYSRIRASFPFQGLVLGCLLILFGTNKAIGQVNLGFSPTVSNVNVNQTFNVDVTVDFIGGTFNVINTFIDFDPTYLEVVSVTVPPSTIAILEGVAPDFTSIANMNSTGRVDYGRFTANPPASQPSTDFTFFTIQFRAIAEPPSGNTTLSYNTVGLRETIVASAGSNVINSLNSGTVNIGALCTPPTANISNTATCNSSPFDLVLSSATGTGPFDLVINGTTYNDINVGGTITTISSNIESIWPPLATPSSVENDNSELEPITVGTRFRSSVDGVITGLRFYQGSTLGVNSGILYTNDGTEIATLTFPVSTNGWVTANFSSPVPIQANTTYVAAYRNSLGYYSVTADVFLTDLNNGSYLTGLQSGTDGFSNGVYIYENAFPTNWYASSGYFADVLFRPTEFTFNLTSVTDDGGCNSSGALQTLTVNSPGCTLPVALTGFSASPASGNSIKLSWSTSSEQNNKGFEIRRSANGQSNWETIGFVSGAGESDITRNYTYLDQNLPARRYYYQLNQVDFDGRSKLSPVVSATLGDKFSYTLEQNFPNPFKGQETAIRFSIPRRTQVQLIVYDINGRVVKTLVNAVKDSGMHVVPFTDNSLPSGIYFYKLMADDFSDVKRMIVK